MFGNYIDLKLKYKELTYKTIFIKVYYVTLQMTFHKSTDVTVSVCPTHMLLRTAPNKSV